jgi:hypothetical protein
MIFRATTLASVVCLLATFFAYPAHSSNGDGDGYGDGIADHVVLPSPPLAPNPFGDIMLSLDLAHETVFLAGLLSYQILNETQALELLPEKYKLHLFQDTGSTEVMIISSETTASEAGKIMVVFRGTDDTADGDWLTNIDLPKVPYGPQNKTLSAVTVVEMLDFSTGEMKNSTISLKVHRGFNGVFSDNLYEQIVAVLETDGLLGRPLTEYEAGVDDQLYYYNNTVHFMGHSLGGANAQLMGTYFAHFQSHIQTHITSLGGPRQGNFAFKMLAESMPNLSTWRMVFCKDIVPRVPSVRYYHAGHLLYNRCTDDSVENGDRVGAYYRQAGDPAQGFADVSFLQWSVSLVSVADMVKHHLGGQYMEWLDFAKDSMGQANWTAGFELAVDSNDTRSLKATTNNGNDVMQIDYEEALKVLQSQGGLQGLRGFHVSD